MNEEERLALLRKVAEVAPKEMGAHLMEDSCPELRSDGVDDTCVRFAELSCVMHLLNDIEDAAACFAMLDAIEGAGFYTCEGTHCKYGGFGNSHLLRDGYFAEALKDPDSTTIKGYGPTRAIAVARAFCAVFGAKE